MASNCDKKRQEEFQVEDRRKYYSHCTWLPISCLPIATRVAIKENSAYGNAPSFVHPLTVSLKD